MGHGLSTEQTPPALLQPSKRDSDAQITADASPSSPDQASERLDDDRYLGKPSMAGKAATLNENPKQRVGFRKAMRTAFARQPRGTLRRLIRSSWRRKVGASATGSVAPGAAPFGWTEHERCESIAGKRQAYLARLGIRHGGLGAGRPAPPLLHPATGPASRKGSKESCVSQGDSAQDDALDQAESLASSQEVDPASDTTEGGDCSRAISTPRGDFRMSFLRKLSYEHVWVPKPQRPRQHSTLIVLDWDDTLLCTSFLSCSRQLASCSGPMVTRRLEGVAQAACQLVELAKSLGETLIITNAAATWVEHSAKKYLPSLLPVISDLEVISARARYERLYPHEVAEWKAQAFLEVQRRRSTESITNLISIGDSSFEMDAALAIGALCPQAIVKTVKFREQPSPEELVKELQLAGDRLRKIVESGRALQVAMERKPAS